MRRAAPVVLAVLVALAAGCGGGDDNAEEPRASAKPRGGCTPVSAVKPKPNGGQMKPTDKLDPQKTYDVVMQTNCGEFTITLDQQMAPNTTSSFVSLARNGFFDGTIFHRIVPNFVIQGGDPTGTGTGGPGYKTVDVPPANATYTKGVVAMAKAGNEPPGTSGSQFFVMTEDNLGLPAEYAIIGKVTKGMDVIDEIGRLGDATERPTQTVTIEKASVVER